MSHFHVVLFLPHARKIPLIIWVLRGYAKQTMPEIRLARTNKDPNDDRQSSPTAYNHKLFNTEFFQASLTQNQPAQKQINEHNIKFSATLTIPIISTILTIAKRKESTQKCGKQSRRQRSKQVSGFSRTNGTFRFSKVAGEFFSRQFSDHIVSFPVQTTQCECRRPV